MDIEGFVRARIDNTNEETLKNVLAERIREYKDIDEERSLLMARSVIDEVKTTLKVNESDDEFLKDIMSPPKADVTMGKMGVGSRGAGDFFVHRRIAQIVSSTNTASEVNPSAQDDGGVVKVPAEGDDVYVTTAVDGVHSRLSDYPFLGGFHVTRATLRDVCVMGANPVSILSDLHLADDGDVGKLFDFTAGVCAVSELLDVPLVAGSTLRVGGDMVIGDRLVSAVGSVGVSPYPPTARKGATDGDIILMTEGAGGGTITTTALYNGFFDVVWDTLNVSFVKASNAIFNNDLVKDIHAMTDVTNGGLRGDAHEISSTTGVGLKFDHEKIKSLVAPNVLNMLDTLDIDPLGVSTDSLMLIVPPEISDDVVKAVSDVGVKIDQIGVVDSEGSPRLVEDDGSETTLTPLFREAAYTKIKKLVGDTTPEDFEKMKDKVQKAADESIRKKERVIDYIRNNARS
ncbi:MAG: AIR synthase-related protein [Methanobrevibacter sp.]